MKRLNDLEEKFLKISEQYLAAKQELSKFKLEEAQTISDTDKQRSTDRNFKEQYMEMREVNKDLKAHYKVLELKVKQFSSIFRVPDECAADLDTKEN